MKAKDINLLTFDVSKITGFDFERALTYRSSYNFYSIDWNSLTTPGIYTMWNQGSGGANYPTNLSQKLGTLLVFGNYDLHQLYFAYARNWPVENIVMRSYESNGHIWSQWMTIPFTEDIPKLVNQISNNTMQLIDNQQLGGGGGNSSS